MFNDETCHTREDGGRSQAAFEYLAPPTAYE